MEHKVQKDPTHICKVQETILDKMHELTNHTSISAKDY